jgi:hypothetical protein
MVAYQEFTRGEGLGAARPRENGVQWEHRGNFPSVTPLGLGRHTLVGWQDAPFRAVTPAGTHRAKSEGSRSVLPYCSAQR